MDPREANVHNNVLLGLFHTAWYSDHLCVSLISFIKMFSRKLVCSNHSTNCWGFSVEKDSASTLTVFIL
jgi:hypothetical protein